MSREEIHDALTVLIVLIAIGLTAWASHYFF